MKRLIDHPAVLQFERAATLNPELRSAAGAERSEEFIRLCDRLFGRSPASLLPDLPANYSWEDDGIYYDLDGDETPEDLAAITAYEVSVDLFVRVYAELGHRSDAALISTFSVFGWDVCDEHGRALNCLVPVAPLLLASARGDFGVPTPGELKVDAATWGESLAREAARFRGSARR